MNLSKDKCLEILEQVQDPELQRGIVSLGMVKELAIDGSKVFIHLETTSQKSELRETLRQSIQRKLSEISSGKAKVEIHISYAPRKGPDFSPKQPLAGIKNIIAIASGKGGVGKSTVSVNLSLTLAKQGFQVGLMDADIYGPNIPLMLGVPHDVRPGVSEQEKMIPISAQGIKMISMGILVPPDQPMVWRGPMLHSAVTQFLQKVEWGDLDFLIIDLPPGTGDVQLSLVQSVPLTGAVIVTTPQEVALMDVRKAVAMFRKTGVSILGVIENMSGEIFGRGGGEKAAVDFQVPFLGQIPLDGRIREGGDSGKPVVCRFPDSEAALGFQKASEILFEQIRQTVEK